MQNNRFWTLSLVVWLLLASLFGWSPVRKVIVILNSLLVLSRTGFALLQACRKA